MICFGLPEIVCVAINRGCIPGTHAPAGGPRADTMAALPRLRSRLRPSCSTY